ncbi:epigen-like [Sardina pilchardus]|uniref:epigen-like n=1 Tax=Sardina pilchardus TaxID=27697 RepID=UPI002E0E4FD3
MAQQTFHLFLQHVSAFAVMALLMTLSGESTEMPQGSLSAAQNHSATLENSTSSQELEMPRLLKLQRSCTSEHTDFCVNGDCHYTPDTDTPSCRCPSTHVGVRCEHLALNTNSQNKTTTEEIIGICLGVALLLGCLTGAIYCCVKRRCKTETLPYKTCDGKENV